MGRTPLNAQELKFEVGEVLVTPTAADALDTQGRTVSDLLGRHQAGDWGDVSDQVRLVNERGLSEGFNLQSTYLLDSGQRLVVVTNGERTLTMIHLDRQVN
jgi:hypothetical protein